MTTENQEFLNIDSQLGYDIIESNKEQQKSLETQTQLLKDIATTVNRQSNAQFELVKVVQENNQKVNSQLERVKDLTITDDNLKAEFKQINNNTESIVKSHESFMDTVKEKLTKVDELPDEILKIKDSITETLAEQYQAYSDYILTLTNKTKELTENCSKLEYSEDIKRLEEKQEEYSKEVKKLHKDTLDKQETLLKTFEDVTTHLNTVLEAIKQNNEEQIKSQEISKQVLAKLSIMNTKVETVLKESEQETPILLEEPVNNEDVQDEQEDR